ncbi:type II toxin-antitoxin system VapC family toxin [Albibacterium indicum]|uniref:type II toxin-antitoxin system VapC family toxin n=1 Tax=Albibacterium indicum TaxID=2292082 RepID=UPI000E528FDA|nr:PIN domain-containing protein [Pedobacter indicus]
MDRLFVDTNIVIDLLQKRAEFYEDAQGLFTLADKRKVKLFISSLTIANTHFILTKHYSTDDLRKVLAKFKVLVEVLLMDDKIIDLALTSDLRDCEDAIQYYTAIENNVDMIITRNKRDFTRQSIPIFTAKEYLTRNR